MSTELKRLHCYVLDIDRIAGTSKDPLTPKDKGKYVLYEDAMKRINRLEGMIRNYYHGYKSKAELDKQAMKIIEGKMV